MRRLNSFLRLAADERGTALIESAIIFPILLVLTFGLAEFGYGLWQYHAVEKATQVGARWLATRHGLEGTAPLSSELYTATVPDCFVDSAATALGTPCSQVAGATGWSATCSGAGGGSCSGTVMSGLLTEMKAYAPFLTAANISVQLRGSNMGFLGRGRAIPLVTVRTAGLTYSFVALNALLGLGPIAMPGFDATLVAEDQTEGPPA